MALADVVTEVLRALGLPGEGRQLVVQARGHEVSLGLDRLALQPPSAPWSVPLRTWPPSVEAWRAATRETLRSAAGGWSALPSWAISAGSEAPPGEWLAAALGGLTIGLRDIAVDGRAPFDHLEIVAPSLTLDLGRPSPALVARHLTISLDASAMALAAWLPGKPRVRYRADGRIGVSRAGWERWGEVPVSVAVEDGIAHFAVEAVEVRGRRVAAPRRWHQHRRLDPATYHPGLRFESVVVDADAGVLRARLSLEEWREPVSLSQLLDLRAHLSRRAPLILRSLAGP